MTRKWISNSEPTGNAATLRNNSSRAVFPAGPDQYWGLRFSPNGEFIYYLIADRASQSVGTLYRVPKLGGRPERVLDNVNGHIAPSPDGQSVAVVRNNDAPGFAAILSVDQAGGPVRRLTRLEWPVVVQALEWAPDGRSLLCALKRRSAAGDRWHVIPVACHRGSVGRRIACRDFAAALVTDHHGRVASRASGLSDDRARSGQRIAASLAYELSRRGRAPADGRSA